MALHSDCFLQGCHFVMRYRSACKSLARPWTETSFSDQDLHYTLDQDLRRTSNRNIYIYIYIYIYICTGCPRRNVPNFGRMFLRLKYTDITQNTHIQSWTVTEIMAREKCGLLAVPRTVPAQLMQSAGQVQYAFSQRPALLIQLCSRLIPKCAVSKR